MFNATVPILEAALTGLGLAYVTEDSVQTYLAAGRLIRVLADWCPSHPGYHLYYPSRRRRSPYLSMRYAIGAVASGHGRTARRDKRHERSG